MPFLPHSILCSTPPEQPQPGWVERSASLLHLGHLTRSVMKDMEQVLRNKPLVLRHWNCGGCLFLQHILIDRTPLKAWDTRTDTSHSSSPMEKTDLRKGGQWREAGTESMWWWAAIPGSRCLWSIAKPVSLSYVNLHNPGLPLREYHKSYSNYHMTKFQKCPKCTENHNWNNVKDPVLWEKSNLPRVTSENKEPMWEVPRCPDLQGSTPQFWLCLRSSHEKSVSKHSIS